MYCPKCQSEMEHAEIQGVRVSRCLQCRGFWFRGNGHLELRKLKGAGAIDIGDAEVGKAFDEADLVRCPDCGETMRRVSEPSQAHIVFEACAAGHGAFFDAGEFRDFSERSLGDLFRKFF